MTEETIVEYDKYYVLVHASSGMALGQNSYYDRHDRAFPGLQKRGGSTGIGYDYVFKFVRVTAPTSRKEIHAIDTVKIVAQWNPDKRHLGVWYWSDYWQMNADDGDNTQWIVEGFDLDTPLKIGQKVYFENVAYRAADGYYWKPDGYSAISYNGTLMYQCDQDEDDAEFIVKRIDV